MKNVINVVGAAFIEHGRIFAARRSYGSSYVVHKFEFVGGKIEDGESGEAALARECREELDLEIQVLRPVGTTEFEYPDKIVNITVYLCRMLGGYKVKEHEECVWQELSALNSDDWAPADRPVLADLVREFSPAYSLVTGATGGIGSAFCEELASRGESLFITGRSREKLETLSNKLKERHPDLIIKYAECDLTDEADRERLMNFAAGHTFCRLVNVAGADIQKAFLEYDQKKITFQSRILFESAVSLTHFCIKNCAKQLKIINISSVSGLYPMPYFAIYSALKGALTNFSVALSREMKGTGVSVTAVLPGAVYTRPDVVEYIKKQGIWGKIAAKSPQFVVKHSLAAADKGKVKYIPGVANKLMRAFTALIPQRMKLRFISKKWSKTRKDAF